MHSSSQEMLPDGRVCWVAVRIPQRVSPSAPGGHLLVSSFLAITRRASVNVPIVVFVWSINFRFPGTNTPMCNCLVVWQLQVLRRMPGCQSGCAVFCCHQQGNASKIRLLCGLPAFAVVRLLLTLVVSA